MNLLQQSFAETCAKAWVLQYVHARPYRICGEEGKLFISIPGCHPPMLTAPGGANINQLFGKGTYVRIFVVPKPRYHDLKFLPKTNLSIHPTTIH